MPPEMDKVEPKEYEANFVQPTVDPSGEYIAYIDLEANELWMFEIDAPDNGSRLILSPDELGLPGLQLADYPMSWAPSSAIENQTLLVTFTDDDGIPAIWDVHPFDESAPLGDELVAYAVSPSYSMSGAAFAFTQIDPETGLRSVRSAGILPSGAVDADDIDNIPEGATECFAPGYNVTDVDVEWLTIYYTCLVDGELQYYRYAQSGGEPERLFLETDYQSLSGMERLVPGPASDHLAFDHEGVIYLTYLTDNDDPDDTDNNRITEVLLQLEPLSLRDISWAFNR